MQKEIIVMVGTPLSGKSTYVKNNYPHYKLISRDDIVMELGNSDNYNDAWLNVDQKLVDKIYNERLNTLLSNNENIVSYPKLHKKNGFNKNSRVNSNYKRTVRIFKNIKSYLVSNSVISESIVSSYFIECLLYNVPDNYYQNYNIEKRFFGILNYLLNEPNFMEMKTQDEQNYLFGDSDNQWDKKHALKFLNWVNSFNR